MSLTHAFQSFQLPVHLVVQFLERRNPDHHAREPGACHRHDLNSE